MSDPVPDLEDAFALVARDVRRGDGAERLSVVEAVAQAYDLVGEQEVYGDDPTAVAYRVVLRRLAQPPTRDELCRLVRKLASPTVAELTTLEEYWTHRVLEEGYV